MSYSVFNVKELVVARKNSDESSSLVGPTYGPHTRWHGAQKISANLQQEQVQLLGDGLILDAQATLDKVEIQVEAALVTPEVEAVIYDMAHSETPDETKLVWHEDSGSVYVGVWARTDKVGKNGEDVVLFFPSVQFAALNRDQSQRQYRTNQFSGSALFTQSTFPIERFNSDNEMVTEQKRIIMMESNRRVAASLITATSTPLTVVTVFPITNHPIENNIVVKVSAQLKRASVNKFTAWLKQGETLIPVLITIGNVDDGTDNQLTVNPTSPLTNELVYILTLKSTICDIHGNKFAADQSLSITTVAA